MAGHSQFKNIMHRKGKQDGIRSKMFSKLAREITVAAKMGLPDPSMNAALRLAVQNAKAQDRTPIVWLVVPKELTMTVRCFKIEDYYSDNTIVCRCEELTLGALREYIRQGCRTLDELKRVTCAGMGPCQGRTCRQLILQELQAATGEPAASFSLPTFRPPVKPIRMGLLLHTEEDEQ